MVADVSAVTWQQAISTLAILPPFANPLSHSAILYSILVPLDSTDRQNGRGWNALSGPHPDEDARERDLSSSAVGEREKRSWTFVRTQERGTIKTRREGTVRCVRASFGYNRFVPAPFLRNTICVFFALLRETCVSPFLCTRTASTRVFIRSSHSNKIRRLPFSSPRRIPSVVGGRHPQEPHSLLLSHSLSFSLFFFLRSTFACQRPTPCRVCVLRSSRLTNFKISFEFQLLVTAASYRIVLIFFTYPSRNPVSIEKINPRLFIQEELLPVTTDRFRPFDALGFSVVFRDNRSRYQRCVTTWVPSKFL